MKRLVLFLIAVAAPLILQAAPASAHQSGCHRWHSCPSDTGSYVCGDTGYTSGCPTSYTTPTTRDYTTPTTAYQYTTSTTAYRYTTTTTAYSSYQPLTTPDANEESEASITGDAIVRSVAAAVA